MKYISLRWYDIPELMVPIRISLITRKLLNQGFLLVKLKSSLRKFYPVLSSFTTYYRICKKSNTTGVTSGAGTAYPSGAPEFTSCFSGVRVTRSLVLYVCFIDRCLSFCTFSFGHCVVCYSSLYGFWFGIFNLFVFNYACVLPMHTFS